MSKDKRFKVGVRLNIIDGSFTGYTCTVVKYDFYSKRKECWCILANTFKYGNTYIYESDVREYNEYKSTTDKILSVFKRKSESGGITEATAKDRGLSPSPNRRSKPINLKFD